jgi:hypothetical protein
MPEDACKNVLRTNGTLALNKGQALAESERAVDVAQRSVNEGECAATEGVLTWNR